MKKITSILLALTMMAGVSFGVDEIGNVGYVVVSPQGPIDGGDYGPYTPGTTTAGFQEAFDYANDAIKEVYIIGGPNVTYELSNTLTIPWGQDWHNEGGNFNMVFTQASGDCIVLDSQMNCHFKFGVISAPNLTSGSILRIWPHTVGPDEFIVCVNVIVDVTAIIGSGSNHPTIGFKLDSPILSHINVGRIENCGTGLYINGGSVVTLDCGMITNCATQLNATGCSSYTVTAAMEPGSVNGANGAVVAGNCSSNVFYLKWEDQFEPGRALNPGTNNSNIFFVNSLDTDNFPASTGGRIFQDRTIGFNVTTPSISSSSSARSNESGYPVLVLIADPGSVTSYTITDASGVPRAVNAAMFAGQTVYLEPYESITLVYPGAAPSWVWKALR